MEIILRQHDLATALNTAIGISLRTLRNGFALPKLSMVTPCSATTFAATGITSRISGAQYLRRRGTYLGLGGNFGQKYS